MRRLFDIRGGLLALTLPLVAVTANGDTAPLWSINGFGTFGVVHSDEDRADFTPNLLADEGAGYSDRWSPKVDTKAGVQVTSNLSSKFKTVLQVISEQGHDGSFEPQVEWAYFSYDVTPDLAVRLGRTLLPTFMASEYRKVGYAMPTVRPAAEVYNLLPVTSSDGIDITYQRRFNEVTNSFHISVGERNTDFPEGFEMEANKVFTLANTIEWRDTTLFASYLQTDLTVKALNPIFDGFRTFGPEGERLANRFDLNDTVLRVVSVGGRYDPGDWFIVGEWANNRSQSVFGEHQGWYLTAGIRTSALTPYLTVADLHAKGDLSHSGLPYPQAQPLNDTLNILLADSTADQRRFAAGVRWDFAPSLALKVQYDRIEIGRGTFGLMSNIQPGFRADDAISLFSTTVDFVF